MKRILQTQAISEHVSLQRELPEAIEQFENQSEWQSSHCQR